MRQIFSETILDWSLRCLHVKDRLWKGLTGTCRSQCLLVSKLLDGLTFSAMLISISLGR